MFSPVSVCLSFFLSVKRITQKTAYRIFIKFYGMVGNNPGTNRLDLSDLDPRLSDLDPKSRSLVVRRSKSLLRITAIKTVVDRQYIKI